MSTTPPSQQPGGYGQPPYPATQQAGPVAKLDTANAFERIFQLYGSQFLILLGLALVIFIPIALLSGLVAASGSLGLIFLLAIIGAAGQALYTGGVVQAVADMRDGRRDFSIPGLLRAAVPFIVPLILASIVFVILFALGLLLLIIPGLLVLTWFCLFTPVIVVERRGVFDAFGRSQDLVKGNAWRVFGVLIVTVVIVFVVGTVLQRIFLGIDDGFAGAFLGNAISNLITAPVFAIVVSTLYFMLRDLREGPSSYPAQPPAA